MKSMKRNVIVSAFLAIALCLSVVAGATFALFTSSAKVNLSITSAKVKLLNATIENKKMYSLTEVNPDTLEGTEEDRTAAGTFYLGGTAEFEGNALTLKKMAPGDRIAFDVKVDNESDIPVKYRVLVKEDGESNLTAALNIFVNNEYYLGDSATGYTALAVGENVTVPVSVELPISAGNDYAEKTATLIVSVEAVQASVKDTTDTPLSFSDGNAHEYTLDKNIRANGVDGVLQVNGSQLTINGDGKLVAVGGIYAGNGGEYSTAVWADKGAKVIINGGTYVNTAKNGDDHYDLIYADRNSTIEIYGGTFINVTPKWTLNCKDYTNSKIYVMGGRYFRFDPSDVKTTPEAKEGFEDPTEVIVPEGYEVIKDGDWYEVRLAEGKFGAGTGAYDDFNDAIKGASNESNVKVTLPANASVELENDVANEGTNARDLTFVGDGTQTVDVVSKAINAEGGMLNYQRGSKFTFKNMTVQAGEGAFDGIVCDELVYENCVIRGKLTLFGKATFINCTFENDMANQYSVWTWGGTDVLFDGCTFNTNGKAILLYGQATAAKPTNLTVNNCTFNDRNNGSAGKAAIEIGNDYNATYTLTVNKITVNGFADGKNTGSKVWANKNSMDAEHLTVTIDKTKVH